jgi:mannose-6-phosphate isomerase-like protein (cupin superfamily)
MVEDIQKLVANKRIILVGNSVEIMQGEYADMINEYDIVVKFGKALTATNKQKKSISSRCDIWVTGYFRASLYDYAYSRGMISKDTKVLLNASKLKNSKHKLPDSFPDYTLMFTEKEIDNLTNRFAREETNLDQFRLSAGFIAILFFTEKVKTYKSLDIIGFDFFSKKANVTRRKGTLAPYSWHLPINIADYHPHDSDIEKDHVVSLVEQNKIKWHVLSNLNKETINLKTMSELKTKILTKDFFINYWGKKHKVFPQAQPKPLYTFEDLSNDLNRFPYLKGLQIIEDQGYRWCLDKVRSGKMDRPMLSKKELYQKWLENRTFVLTISEYLKEEFYYLVSDFEEYFDRGTVNIYCSRDEGSKSFPAHADSTENFLLHSQGDVKWKMYEGFHPEEKGKVIDEFVLKQGDVLYIPKGQYHEVETVGPRILLSVHFHNKPNQSLDKFNIGKTVGRDSWYDWAPPKL